ncbi:hypothetical protein BerOc1_01892 [Pseudodesulfovibrio hydrargyri]|uniref:UPF0251 protein BerOc1_01892 n=1 Tax=Pseudodesulfovibrio hydrargyri TaxID=2125990 RepID=A0A1J5MVW3_9BACT|nr:DUF134 domain-containing protein [Pseudodesulfovibrio hydrargyri]OIQ49964.1 hypothetical protein BerOc1_01892 [Pseudodesulfovibrio hydrargyri]
MGRRKIRRTVQREPGARYYKPQGIPMRELQNATLTLEELEALRLADAQGLTQEEGAQAMGVSRATFGRVLGAARRIVATALAEGQAIRIEGGHYAFAEDAWECPKLSPDRVSETIGDESMPGMDGTGPRGAGGGGRCMGGRGRGMGRGRGVGGQGRGMGGQNMGQGAGTGQGRGAGQRSGEQQQIKDTAMSRIAVTTEGPTLDDRVDPRFGRAAGFAIVDPQTMAVVQYVDNGGSQAMAQGAGIQAAENVANAGASVLLTGYVGPKAFAALEAAGIAVGQDVDNLTVRQAVEKYVAGEVDMAANANAPAGGNK